MFDRRKVYHLSSCKIQSSENVLKSCWSINDTPTLQKNNKKNILQPFFGLFYTFLTCIFITMSSVFVKQLTYISPGQLSLVRNAGIFVGSLPVAVYSVKQILGPKKDRKLLIMRGFLTATALYLNLTAYRYLPLAEAAVIMSTLPALVNVIARIYLKEPCGVVQSLCIFVTVCGVLLSIRLPELLSKKKDTQMDSFYIVGLATAVGCVLILSVSLVTLRKMKDTHFSVLLLYSGFIGSLENGLVNFFVASYELPRCGWDPLWVMLIGVFGFIGHCTLTLAIQAEAVGIVSVMKASMDIVIAMVFQIIFFKVQPDVYNLSGACIVIASISIIGIRKWMLSLPNDANIRKKFRYLLP